MNNRLICSLALAITSMFSASSNAIVIGYVDNLTGNSSDWINGVGSYSTIDFSTHALGALDGSFYAGSDGLTMALGGSGGSVIDGQGPLQGAQQPPTSGGEGVHDGSRHLHTNSGAMSLTLSFDQALSGAGLFLSDLWSPNSVNRNLVTVSAYTGVNGTGSLLGSFGNPIANFQNFNLYFMGISSSDGDIRSLVFNSTGGGGDRFGIDDIMYSSEGGVVPTPATIALFGLGLVGLGWSRRKKLS